MGIERRAIATLLYDESFVDGALALGASIKAHLREKDVDLVTLATSGVPVHDSMSLHCIPRLPHC